MNYLAIDTANEYMTVLAVKDGKETRSFLPDCAMRHSVALMTEVDRVLKQAELTLSACDFFACVVGAGSFTGIRIGISTVKGFCLACGKPALPVTSFDLSAYNALEGAKKPLLSLVDAGHGAYYACAYDGEGNVLAEPEYLTEEEVVRKSAEGFSLVAAVSAGRELLIARQTPVALFDPAQGLRVAVEKKAKAGAFADLQAVYVRKSSAELNLAQKKA